MTARVASRQTADERRKAVLDAATHEFAQRGLYAGSTDEIARAAGISQPYLFRLFGSKKELYLAAAQRCVDELQVVFADAAAGKSGEDALRAMGDAYLQLMQNRDRLMLMLKSWTSCDDPDIARLTRTAWRNLVDLAEQSSGEPAPVVSRFFASGMLLTIFMSLNLIDDPEPWAVRLLEACKETISA
jgi:AcrR family transcriptional regulator